MHLNKYLPFALLRHDSNGIGTEVYLSVVACAKEGNGLFATSASDSVIREDDDNTMMSWNTANWFIQLLPSTRNYNLDLMREGNGAARRCLSKVKEKFKLKWEDEGKFIWFWLTH